MQGVVCVTLRSNLVRFSAFIGGAAMHMKVVERWIGFVSVLLAFAAQTASATLHKPLKPDDFTQAQTQSQTETVPAHDPTNDFSSIGDTIDPFSGRLSIRQGAAIPDAMTSDLVVEIKNSARVDFTRQLRIETEAGQQAGKQSVLVTGSNTCVSGNCQQAFDSIIRLDYLGPQNIPVPQAEP